MTRTRTVILCSWCAIATVVTITHSSFNVLVVVLFVAAFALALVLAWRFYRSTFILLVCGSLLCAGLYGSAYVHTRPGHPAQMGTLTDILGTVQSISVKRGQAYVMLDVVSQGTPGSPCFYSALWRTSVTESRALTQGANINARGVFVLFEGSSPPVQQWLSPTFDFEGHLLQTTPASSDNAVLQQIKQAMANVVGANNERFVDLALSMIFGRAATLSDATKEIFLSAGVTHLLAASGANVILFNQLLSFLLRPIFVLPWTRSWRIERLTVLGASWLFVALCGMATPIVRAAMLITYRSLASLFHRTVSGPAALSISCLFFALWNPYKLTSISGAFSILATFAVIMASDNTGNHKGTHSRWLSLVQSLFAHMKDMFIVGLYVEIYMTPFVWWWFGQWTPYGIFSTLVCEPLVIVLMPLTIAWGGLSMVNLPLHISILENIAQGVGWLAVHTLHVLFTCLTWIASRQGSLISLPTLPTWALAAYYAGVVWIQFRPNLRIPILYVCRVARVK